MQTTLAPEQPVLDFLWLELTNRCNLQCAHCYSQSGPYSGDTDVLSEGDYVRLMQESYALGCRQIQLIGGEPTLNKSLPTLIQQASTIGYDLIEVFTNLVSLSSTLIESFHAHGVSVATSFYSSKSATHDRITKSLGSFRHTTANIRRVLAAGIDLRVGVIEMDANAGDYDATVQFLKGLGVKDISYDRVRGFGRAQAGGSCDMGDLCGQCATNVLAIGPDGVVAPCIMSKHWAVGSVLTESVADIAMSATLRDTRQRIAEVTTTPLKAECQPVCGPNRQQCVPECGPSRQCIPCAPNGGHKCSPNSFCSPAK